MKEEEKFFDFKEKAYKYIEEQEKKGRRLVSMQYRQTTFFASLLGAWGYIYTFIWEK